MATEYGWLIERRPDGTPGPAYYDINPDVSGFWTLDHNEALRFARKIDAERMIAYLGIEEGDPVEHAWCDGPDNEQAGLKRFQDRLHKLFSEAADRINAAR